MVGCYQSYRAKMSNRFLMSLICNAWNYLLTGDKYLTEKLFHKMTFHVDIGQMIQGSGCVMVDQTADLMTDDPSWTCLASIIYRPLSYSLNIAENGVKQVLMPSFNMIMLDRKHVKQNWLFSRGRLNKSNCHWWTRKSSQLEIVMFIVDMGTFRSSAHLKSCAAILIISYRLYDSLSTKVLTTALVDLFTFKVDWIKSKGNWRFHTRL